MENEELIAKIKAEIERLKEKAERRPHATPLEGFECMGKIKVCNELLSLLSTIESEKPMNQDEELNEEIKKEMVKLPFFIHGKDQIAFARHFAQWGAENLKK